MSSANPYNVDPNAPSFTPQPPPKSNTGWIIAIVVAVVSLPVLLMCMGILVGLLLPAVQAAREAARRASCANNIRQIALALHNYESEYGAFPPPYTVDANGRPLHSWRTLLLPYMEQQALYDQIDLDKPWDDPANAAFADISVPIYTCPSSALPLNSTTYVVVVDPSGIFNASGTSTFNTVTDGTSATLLVVETDAENAVQWMEPQDIDLATFLAAGNGQNSHTGGSNAAMADRSVQFLSNNTPPQTRQAMVSQAAGD